MHQSLQGATFHIEHVIPRSRGGSAETDNLAWACPSCNLHKSDRIAVFFSEIGDTVELFHPRAHDWNAHFEWDEYSVVAKTSIGAATIEALDLNHERRLKIRHAEQLFDLFPPDNN